jgi:electron transport complex protein RnfD
MSFLKVTSPHTHTLVDTPSVMRHVILATVPGIIALTYFFGWGTIVNIAWACLSAMAWEALVLKLRHRPLGFYLKDGSALLTAVLLAIALPPYSPWWLTMTGTFFAIIIAKQLYGGMGYNPFNPAMAAYVVLLISFPVQMTNWAAPLGAGEGVLALGPIEAFLNNFSIADTVQGNIDAYTMATPLDLMKQNNSATMAELWSANGQFGWLAGAGWEWVNAMFLLGGIYLLYKRVYTWHAPVSMLIALTIMSAAFYSSGSSHSGGSPFFHLFSGATMLGAFFIVTDPVTSAVSNKGRMIYGACIGILVFSIRYWGNYPDAIAFAVLLMNFAAPLIDQYTQPRTYGHKKAGAGK